MGIRFTRSAHKHGIDEGDALHAVLNFAFRVEGFDEPRIPGGGRPDLFIGPARDGATMLEVFVARVTSHDIVVFHVMVAREKIITIAEGAHHD